MVIRFIILFCSYLILTAVDGVASDNGTPAYNSEADCTKILQAYAQLEVKASQAEAVSQIQKAIGIVCSRLIEAERTAKTPALMPNAPDKR